MKKLILAEKGFASVVVLVGMLLVAVSLPIATKLVQQNQENRSSAATKTTCYCYVGSSQGVTVAGGSTSSLETCKAKCAAGACKCTTSTVSPVTVKCTYTYSPWSPAICPSNGKQTRSVISKSPDGCSGGSPVTSQTCTYDASKDTNKSDGSVCASNSECSSGFCSMSTGKCESIDEEAGNGSTCTISSDCLSGFCNQNHCVSSSTSCYSGNKEWPKDAAICTDNIAYTCRSGVLEEPKDCGERGCDTDGTCKELLENGSECSGGFACKSGFCNQGYCVSEVGACYKGIEVKDGNSVCDGGVEYECVEGKLSNGVNNNCGEDKCVIGRNLDISQRLYRDEGYVYCYAGGELRTCVNTEWEVTKCVDGCESGEKKCNCGCGAADGLTLESAPYGNSLCHDGKTASAVTETDSDWVWTCGGDNCSSSSCNTFKKKKKDLGDECDTGDECDSGSCIHVSENKKACGKELSLGSECWSDSDCVLGSVLDEVGCVHVNETKRVCVKKKYSVGAECWGGSDCGSHYCNQNHCVSTSTSCYSGNKEWPKDAAICTDNIAYICNAGGLEKIEDCGKRGCDTDGTCGDLLGVGSECDFNGDCVVTNCIYNESLGKKVCGGGLRSGSECKYDGDCLDKNCVYNAVKNLSFCGIRLSTGFECNKNNDCVGGSCVYQVEKDKKICGPRLVDGSGCREGNDCTSGICKENLCAALVSCSTSGGSCVSGADDCAAKKGVVVGDTDCKSLNPVCCKVVLATGVNLSATSASLYYGDQQKVTATVIPDDVSDDSVTWSSGNPSLVGVVNGLITVLKDVSEVTTVTVTAKTSNGKAASLVVTVSPKVIAATSVSVSPSSGVIIVGKSLTLKASVSPTDYTGKIEWSSNNNSMATVSQSGVVTAKSVGLVIITATIDGKSAVSKISINDCIIDNNCSASKFCNGGTCMDDFGLGKSCDRNEMCQSGKCDVENTKKCIIETKEDNSETEKSEVVNDETTNNNSETAEENNTDVVEDNADLQVEDSVETEEETEDVSSDNDESIEDFSPTGNWLRDFWCKLPLVKCNSDSVLETDDSKTVPTKIPTKAVSTSGNNLKLNFKLAFSGVKSDSTCWSDLSGLNVKVSNLDSATSQSFDNVTLARVENNGIGVTNMYGDQIFKVVDLSLGNNFVGVNKNNLIQVKSGWSLPGLLCVDNQKSYQTIDCNLSLTSGSVYSFENYSLVLGDVDGNGLINSLDYSLVISKASENQAKACGKKEDINLDGWVNQVDVDLIRDRIGSV